MNFRRKTIFISDLHLEAGNTDTTSQFLSLLKKCVAESIDALYILGDLFEVWIGDDDRNSFHETIIAALNQATKNGLAIYFMYGNRDFLIGKRFLRETGCQLLDDEEKILLYGTPILLMHGDTLCTRDLEYLKARRKGRSVFWQTLFLCLPLRLRKHIANKMRAKSFRHTQSTAKEIMDVTQAEVERVMKKHQVNILIHGHTHRPHVHQFNVAENKAERIVLGAWHQADNILIWDETGKKEIISICS